MPKVPAELIPGDRAQEWMEIIKADTEEALEMARERTKNPMIDKAIDAIYHLSADERLREQIRVQRKALFDYGNDIAVARDEGIEIGRLRGLEEGKTEGRAEGEALGVAKGKAEAYFEFVETLRRKGMSEDQTRFFLENDYKH